MGQILVAIKGLQQHKGTLEMKASNKIITMFGRCHLVLILFKFVLFFTLYTDVV